MAKLERGTKRRCQECEVKFYDLNRDPIICPACGAQFIIPSQADQPENSDAEKEATIIDEVAVEVNINDPEIISLDELEDEASVVEDIPDVADVEVDDNINADQEDTFLEVDDDDTKIDLVVPTAGTQDE